MVLENRTEFFGAICSIEFTHTKFMNTVNMLIILQST